MKCPKCGTECVKRDAGMVRSIMYDFCPKCKTEPTLFSNDDFLDEFEEILIDEDLQPFAPAPVWPNPFKIKQSTREYITLKQSVYTNKTLTAQNIYILNSSFDSIGVEMVEISSNTYTKVCTLQTGLDTTIYVPIGYSVIITPINPPQEIEWDIV